MHAMHKLLLLALMAAGAGVGGCAGQAGRPFADMTAAEHRRAAERERRAAMDEAAKAREQLGPASPPGIGEGVGPGGYVFFDPSWDPLEPEYYTVDVRVHVPGECHAGAARRHREQAERHERAAKELDEIERQAAERRERRRVRVE